MVAANLLKIRGHWLTYGKILQKMGHSGTFAQGCRDTLPRLQPRTGRHGAVSVLNFNVLKQLQFEARFRYTSAARQ